MVISVRVGPDVPITSFTMNADGRSEHQPGGAFFVTRGEGRPDLTDRAATGLFGIRQPLVADEAWVTTYRALGPLHHHLEPSGEMTARCNLSSADGRGLVSEERSYRRARTTTANVLAFDVWTVRLHDNPFSDAWLLGLLLATAMGSRSSLD
jgi:hypothetical protein